jgi:hypothetical protein
MPREGVLARTRARQYAWTQIGPILDPRLNGPSSEKLLLLGLHAANREPSLLVFRDDPIPKNGVGEAFVEVGAKTRKARSELRARDAL